MAIALDILEQSGFNYEGGNPLAVYVMPPVAVQHVAAAGNYPLSYGSRTLVIRNHGDEVYVRVNVDSTTQASGTDSKSFRLKTDETFPIHIRQDGSTFSIDIRAVV